MTTHGNVAKALVWLWYVPILIILGMGTYVTFVQGAPTEIVDKARTLQDTEEASQSLEPLGREQFDFVLGLDQSFSLKGVGVSERGSFRAGQRMELPLVLRGEPGRIITSVRAQLLDAKDNGLLPGLLVTVRSCETEWKKMPTGYECAGANSIEQSTTPVGIDTLPLMDAGESVKPKGAKYLLFQFTVDKDIIVPVSGYRTKLQLLTSGLNEPVTK